MGQKTNTVSVMCVASGIHFVLLLAFHLSLNREPYRALGVRFFAEPGVDTRALELL